MFSVYVVTLILLAVPDRQCMLIIWLMICMVCILGHWATYFISFQYFKGKLEELWVSYLYLIYFVYQFAIKNKILLAIVSFLKKFFFRFQLPLAIVTILYMALYALPVFYIYFVNWIAEKKPSNHSAERRSLIERSDVIP